MTLGRHKPPFFDCARADVRAQFLRFRKGLGYFLANRADQICPIIFPKLHLKKCKKSVDIQGFMPYNRYCQEGLGN